MTGEILEDDHLMAHYVSTACELTGLTEKYHSSSKQVIEKQQLDRMSSLTGIRDKLTEIIPVIRRDQ